MNYELRIKGLPRSHALATQTRSIWKQASGVRGQSLFEVMFAIGMSALIITSIVVLAGNAISNSTFSRNKALAGRFTQEAIEWLRSQRDTDWEAFLDKASTSTWCLPSLDWSSAKIGVCGDGDVISSNSNFKRELNFIVVDSGNVESKAKVYWQDGKGFHEVSTVTNFTDWRRQ